MKAAGLDPRACSSCPPADRAGAGLRRRAPHLGRAAATRSTGWPAALAARGLGDGAPVALVLPNVPAFVIGFLAILRAGGVVVPLNPHFKEAELEFHFRECGVRAVITDSEGAPVLPAVAARLESPPELFPSIEPLARATAARCRRRPRPDDDAVFQYSSGSTGRPKRVPRTHRHLRPRPTPSGAPSGLSAEDSIFCTIALFHTYGMGCCLLAAVRAGATLVVFDNPNPFVLQRGRALALLERERCHGLPRCSFHVQVLAEASEDADLSSLRLAFSAAAALPRSTFAAFQKRFAVPVRQLYGCTEAGCVTVNVDEDPVATSDSVGTPIEGVELRIVDEAGNPVDAGRIGDVLIRSTAMTPGYADAGELNGEAFRDGWFASGDRGRIDDKGRLLLTGRVKRLIDVRGDKVDPVEVEDVLAVHPKVAEVVVVGVESDVPGEEPSRPWSSPPETPTSGADPLLPRAPGRLQGPEQGGVPRGDPHGPRRQGAAQVPAGLGRLAAHPAELAAGHVAAPGRGRSSAHGEQRKKTPPAASSGVAGRPERDQHRGHLRASARGCRARSPRRRSRSCSPSSLAGGQARLDEAEGDRVHVDLELAPLLGERLRQADDAGLAGRVVGLAGVAHRARDRRDVDDLAEDLLAFLALLLGGLAQVRRGGADDAERHDRVDVEHRLELLVGHLVDRRRPRCSRRC